MRKIAIILAAALCLTLCGCPAAPEEPEIPESSTPFNTDVLEVHITAGKIEAGMTVKDVLVEVTINHQPVACRVELTALTDTGYYIMAENEPVAEDFLVRLDMFYSLPKGYTVDDINEVVDCDGGEYDGTGSVGYDDNGCVEAWSHALYGEAAREETQPQEQTQPTEQTQPATAPETQPHVHSWTEQNPGFVYISCTADSQKTYTCSCGETKTETVPAPGHDLTEPSVSSATCTQSGSKVTTCKRCGAGFIDEIPATGHTWTEWEKENGLFHKHTCTVCGTEETAAHNIPSGEVTCTDCGEDIIN